MGNVWCPTMLTWEAAQLRTYPRCTSSWTFEIWIFPVWCESDSECSRALWTSTFCQRVDLCQAWASRRATFSCSCSNKDEQEPVNWKFSKFRRNDKSVLPAVFCPFIWKKRVQHMNKSPAWKDMLYKPLLKKHLQYQALESSHFIIQHLSSHPDGCTSSQNCLACGWWMHGRFQPHSQCWKNANEEKPSTRWAPNSNKWWGSLNCLING